MRVHLEQENTQEKEKFFQLRENMKTTTGQNVETYERNCKPTLYTRRY